MAVVRQAWSSGWELTFYPEAAGREGVGRGLRLGLV